MSVTYSLHRLNETLSVRPLCIESRMGDEFLPFGPLEAIARRLATALESEGPVAREDLPGGPWTNPFTGQPFEIQGRPMKLPPHVKLRFWGPSGELESSLWGDPVKYLSINRCAPQDFLPIVDALPDLAPFAISSDSDEEVRNPEASSCHSSSGATRVRS